MSGLSLPCAVFGPLATGADVRLLAASRGLALPDATVAELSRFYSAAWASAGRHGQPYWAWFRVCHEYWTLAKAQSLGDGVMGSLFVVWFALLDNAAREAVGERSFALWHSTFPEP